MCLVLLAFHWSLIRSGLFDLLIEVYFNDEVNEKWSILPFWSWARFLSYRWFGSITEFYRVFHLVPIKISIRFHFFACPTWCAVVFNPIIVDWTKKKEIPSKSRQRAVFVTEFYCFFNWVIVITFPYNCLQRVRWVFQPVFSLDLPNFTGFYLVLLCFIGFYLVLQCFTGFYLVLLGFT